MIECRELSKSYGDFSALEPLTLAVPQGESFGFIGPNGAGKTTTIRILATLSEPTSGTAKVGGYCVEREPDDVRRVLGYMPDKFGVYDGMRVWEYLDFFAGAYRIDLGARSRLIDEVLSLTDLGHKREFFVEALSTGMRQRLCLAKTLLHDPEVLILDEPASGLDPRARIELRELLRELTKMGKTLFVSSHILPELADFCSSVGILEAGSLVTAGSVQSIMEQVGGARQFVVKVLHRLQEAAAKVEEFEKVDQVEVEEHFMRFLFHGSLEELAEVSEMLVTEKFGLLELRESSSNLEEVFLKVTKGVVR